MRPTISLSAIRASWASSAVGAAFILIRGGIFAASFPSAEGGRLLARIFGAGKILPAAWEHPLVEFGRRRAAGRLWRWYWACSLYRKQEILQRLFGVANRLGGDAPHLRSARQPYYGLNKLIHEKSRIWGASITVFSLCAIFLLIWYLRR